MAEAMVRIKISKEVAARHPAVASYLAELNIPDLRTMATNVGYMELEVGVREFFNDDKDRLDTEIVLRVREPGYATPTDSEKVHLVQDAFIQKYNPPCEVKWASLNIVRDERIEHLQRLIQDKTGTGRG